MFFILTKQATDILIYKYNIKKSLLRKIESKVNMLEIVKNKSDYFELLESIISTFSYLNVQIKQFSKGKDKLILGMTLDDVIKFEIKRKYGERSLENRLNLNKQKRIKM